MRLRPVISIILLFSAIAAGLWLRPQAGAEAARQDKPEALRAAAAPAAPSRAIRVRTLTLEPRSLEEEIVVPGELQANESVELRSETSGRVTAIHFQEGQRVARGDLLVKINDEELQAELTRAELQQRLAAQREARTGKLLAEGTVSQDVYDEAKSRLEVLAAEAELIRARIRQTEIRAPFAGIIGLRQVSEGSYLSPNVPVAELHSLHPIKVDIHVAEKYAGRLAAGDPARFTVAGQTQPVGGRIYALEPRIDAETRTLRLRAQAPNPSHRLLPGAFVEVRLVLGAIDDAILIPSIALMPGATASRVYIVQDGRAVERQVRTGERTATDVRVLEGLAAGDQLIVSGLQQLRPGALVEAVEATAESPS